MNKKQALISRQISLKRWIVVSRPDHQVKLTGVLKTISNYLSLWAQASIKVGMISWLSLMVKKV